MSSEISGQEIELRRNVPYPEVPENKKTGVEKVTDILVYQGKVSEEQVRLALETQKNNPRQDLGKILLSWVHLRRGPGPGPGPAARARLCRTRRRDIDRTWSLSYPRGTLRKHGAIRSGYPAAGTSWLR